MNRLNLKQAIDTLREIVITGTEGSVKKREVRSGAHSGDAHKRTCQ